VTYVKCSECANVEIPSEVKGAYFCSHTKKLFWGTKRTVECTAFTPRRFLNPSTSEGTELIEQYLTFNAEKRLRCAEEGCDNTALYIEIHDTDSVLRPVCYNHLDCDDFTSVNDVEIELILSLIEEQEDKRSSHQLEVDPPKNVRPLSDIEKDTLLFIKDMGGAVLIRSIPEEQHGALSRLLRDRLIKGLVIRKKYYYDGPLPTPPPKYKGRWRFKSFKVVAVTDKGWAYSE